jgi:hypothetical protein
MKSEFVVRSAAALIAMTAVPGVAFAQAGWVPGSEIVGQPIQVTTNGTTNTIYLDQGGAARLVTPAGNTVPGTWQAANGQLCVSNGSAQECFPYNGPFQAGQPQTLTSSCNSTSTWLAQATNQAPVQGQKGERGQ